MPCSNERGAFVSPNLFFSPELLRRREHAGELMELKDYLRVVRRRWVSIVATTLMGLAVAASLTLMQTPQFQAKSQLFVSVKGTGSAADVTQGNAFAEKRVTSYVSLATSPRVLQAAAQELNLSGEKALAGKVTAASPAQTVLIDITAVDPNPEAAANIANSVATELISAVNQVEDVNIVHLSVFERAMPASAPSSPKVPTSLALGLLLGLLVGAAYAFIRELLDNKVRGIDDVERTVGAGILGTFATDPNVEREPLVTQGDQYSHRAESFRQLRTHLHFTNLDGGSQTVVVSSAISGEGKTSTAVNLAIMLAESGTRVLLVDADLRRPRVARTLGIEGSVGLSGVLSHTVAVEDAIQTWGRGDTLHVLASGRSAPNPSELLGSTTMEKLIARFEADYEVVIIDAPPLLPVTDPALLGSICSGVVLVVSADGRTNRGDVIQAVANLESVKARLLGVVVNRLGKSATSSSYYDYRPELLEPTKRGKAGAKRNASRFRAQRN